MSRDPADRDPSGPVSRPRPSPARQDLVLVGVVGAPHGVHGEVRLKAFTEDPEAAGDYGPVLTEDGRSFDLTVVRALKDDMVVARLSGVADRDQAAALTHLRLLVPREKLPEPEEDEFYASDLVGLAVIGPGEALLGTVTGVVDYGAGDLLDVAPPDGRPGVLLPFTKAFVPVVDLAGRRLLAEPPAGLFDHGSEEDEGPPRKARTKRDKATPTGAPVSDGPAAQKGSSEVTPEGLRPAPAPRPGRRSRW